MADEIAGLTREQLTALLRMHVTKRAEARHRIAEHFTQVEAERRNVSYANVRITRLLDAMCDKAGAVETEGGRNAASASASHCSPRTDPAGTGTPSVTGE